MEIDKPELPEIQRVLLDRALLETLFADIEQLGQQIEVRFRHDPELRGTLPQTLSGFLDGSIQQAQIRYYFEERTWSDTLVANPEGVELVRVPLPDALSEGPCT